MKRIGGWVLAGVGIVLAGAAVDMAWAQAGARPVVRGSPVLGAPGAVAPAPGDKRQLAIRRMPRLNKVKQQTPQYSTTASKTSPNRPRDWALFEVEYTTIPEWMDEVVVTCYLMAERRGAEAKKEYSFYQTTVRYTDVARGEHTACVVLPPPALLRNGDQFIGFAVEMTAADGTLLDAKNESTGSVLPVDWWKDPKVTENKSVVKRDGLVDRTKTPFGLINIDDYEAVK
jgi:hypothetical protein